MKKIIIAAIAMAFSVAAYAGTPEASEARIAKLKEISPEKVSAGNVDVYAGKAQDVKKATIEISEKLNELNAIAKGETEGELSLEVAQELYKKIEGQGNLVLEAGKLAPSATADAAKAKPLSKPKALKSVAASTEAIKIAGEETAYQLKLIQEVLSNIAQ